jgi:hypothetical protein
MVRTLLSGLKWLHSRFWDVVPVFGPAEPKTVLQRIGHAVDVLVCRIAESLPPSWCDQNDPRPVDPAIMAELLRTFPMVGSALRPLDVFDAHDAVADWLAMPWVRFLACDVSRDGFARRLSLLGPVDVWVADAVWTIARAESAPTVIPAVLVLG